MKIFSPTEREQWLKLALVGEELGPQQWDALNRGNWGDSLSERLELLRALHIPVAPMALWDLWLPLAQAIARKRCPGKVFFQGILGPQGSGKSTLAKGLVLILERLGLRAVALSLDDFYLTWAERQSIADFELPDRGPPGTHDVALAIQTLANLKQQKHFTWIPRFDKSAYQGQGERWAWPNLPEGAVLIGRILEEQLNIHFCLWQGQRIALPENLGTPLPIPKIELPNETFVRLQHNQSGGFEIVSGGQSWPLIVEIPPTTWELLSHPVDVVLLEGWFVGIQPIPTQGNFSPLTYRSNQCLANYLPLWKYLDQRLILRPEHSGLPLAWRTLAEQERRRLGHGAMADTKIAQFVNYFERALPNELFFKPLSEDPAYRVITLNRDHLPVEVANCTV